MGAWSLGNILIFRSFCLLVILELVEARLSNFQGIYNSLPSNDPNRVSFLLKDHKNLSQGYPLVYGDAGSLDHAGYLRNTKVRFFIHGFTLNYINGGCYPLLDAFIKVERRTGRFTNSICVDWEALSSPNRTSQPATGTTVDSIRDLVFLPFVLVAYKTAAERIADFLIFLKDTKYLKSYDDVHLIGHSLGAHAAGAAGYFIKQKTGRALGRITGLDPSGPGEDHGVILPKYKLNKDKAKYVDVTHTDLGNWGTSKLGGHVDFFANGGRTADQIKCQSNDLEHNIINQIRACGHNLAIEYYERAVLGEKIFGCRCRFNRFVPSPLKQPCPKRNCNPRTPYGLPTPLPKSAYGTYFLDVPLVPAREVQDDFMEVPLEIFTDLEKYLDPIKG